MYDPLYNTLVHTIHKMLSPLKQIHETMSDEDDQIMISSNLINDEEQSKSLEDMEMIKQVANDFVKTLSQEALEIVKEKTEQQPKQFQLQVPTVAVTFSSEPDLSTMSDGFPAGEDVTMPEIPEIISDQFQFQASFRAHFVRDFDYVTESVSVAVNGQAEHDKTKIFEFGSFLNSPLVD